MKYQIAAAIMMSSRSSSHSRPRPPRCGSTRISAIPCLSTQSHARSRATLLAARWKPPVLARRALSMPGRLRAARRLRGTRRTARTRNGRGLAAGACEIRFTDPACRPFADCIERGLQPATLRRERVLHAYGRVRNDGTCDDALRLERAQAFGEHPITDVGDRGAQFV